MVRSSASYSKTPHHVSRRWPSKFVEVNFLEQLLRNVVLVLHHDIEVATQACLCGSRPKGRVWIWMFKCQGGIYKVSTEDLFSCNKIPRNVVHVLCDNIAYMVVAKICFVSNFFHLKMYPNFTPFVRCIMLIFLLMRGIHVLQTFLIYGALKLCN